ncbi:MAG: ABC transporter ATP-binding protein [Rhodospirillales bacterium]|nr:MAG: ABC transporter ATP-binding protein [Rhodospirillales bacterium]
MSGSAVEFIGVTRRFGRVVAVDDVSFRVGSGTLLTLLGPSGCGKTTVLRMVAGLEMPSAGVVRIGDADVTRLSAAERDVGMVFQSYALFPHMDVRENVAYGLAVSKLSRAEQADRARAVLAKVGLAGYERRQVGALSGGQQQRVALARALAVEPRVMLFDEPLSNLDAKLRRRMRDEIRDLQRELGITAVYVTHDQEEAMAVADTIVVMRDGRVAQRGAPVDLYERPVDRFVADFIGGANLIDVEIGSAVDGRAAVPVGGLTVSLPTRDLRPGPAALAVRYAAIRLSPATPDAGLTGVVRKATYLGAHLEFTVRRRSASCSWSSRTSPTRSPPAPPSPSGFRDRGLALVPR